MTMVLPLQVLGALIEIATTFGDVVVVAPDAPQSAMGHAITINDTIYCNRIDVEKNSPQKEYSCSGHTCRLCENCYQ